MTSSTDDAAGILSRSGGAQQRLRILLTAYFYPPMNIIGARRPHALAKWLRREGHDVVVLTSLHSGRPVEENSVPVIRARDLLATRLNWRRGNVAAMTGQTDGIWEPGLSLWGSIFVPDLQVVSWIPFAIGSALRLNRREPFDAVVTTSPVDSTHLVGAALARLGVTWIADLRDGWCFEPPREPLPLRVQRRIDAALERTLLRAADGLVAVTDPITVDLERRLGIPATTITNGFDPEDSIDKRVAAGATGERRITLVHTGRLGASQTLEPVLEALGRIVRDDEALRGKVEIVLAGARTERERRLYADPRYEGLVRHLGFVSRAEAIELQQRADILLLVTSGRRSSEATGKLYEYLAARRPILVLGDRTAAAAIVERAGAGVAIPVANPDAAEQVLREMIASPPVPPSEDAIAQYAYPQIAARYEEVIRAAIARRVGKHGR